MSDQKKALQTPRDVVVGTPGRILQVRFQQPLPASLSGPFLAAVRCSASQRLAGTQVRPGGCPWQHMEEQNLFIGDVKILACSRCQTLNPEACSRPRVNRLAMRQPPALSAASSAARAGPSGAENRQRRRAL